MFYGRHICLSKKRGPEVGKTKRGKGTKLMVVADGQSIPLGVSVASASPHEITLIEKTIDQLGKTPEHLVGDKAYDSKELSWSFQIEAAENANFRMDVPSDVTSAVGKLNGQLHGWAITDGLLPVGNITTKCIKLFSISLVL